MNMKATRITTLLALLLMAGGVTMKAQVNEPIEFFYSPDILAYHICEWDDGFIMLNADIMGEGRYVMLIDQEGNLAHSEAWYDNVNTCSFLTESMFFKSSDGSRFFYYVNGPDRPVMYKVTISNALEFTTFEFADAFPFPEEITHDDWWNFAWLPNDDGSTFVSGVYIEGNHSVQMMVRYNEAGEITHQWSEITSRATTSLLPPERGASGCRLVMEDPDAKDVNSECVFFDDSLNVVDTKHSIYNQAIGIYRPHYEYFAVHPETDKVYLISDVSFPAFNGNPEIKADVYMGQFNPDFTQTKCVLGPYTPTEYDQMALCEAIDFHGENIFMCGYMNTMFGGNAPDTDNFYVAMLDGNLNIVGEIYYHNEERMVVPYSILVLESGVCLVSTAGKDRKSGEMQQAIFKLSHAIFDGIEEAHDAGFALAIAYPNPGRDVLNIRTALQNAHVEIYDMSGKQIYNQEITSNITIINTSYWPSGTYFWKVISNNKEAESGKWIKQ